MNGKGKVLVITQKIDKNDDVLGFFHEWIEAFSRRLEKVIIIAQFVGEYDLPENVEVFSLGKEKGYSKFHQLFNFYKLLFKNLSRVDVMFVHMISFWVVAGAPVFKIFGKKVYLWYVHKKVNFMLELAEKFVDKIFTASKESCRLESDKIIITGHGINVDKFLNNPGTKNGKFRIITVGRITPVKNLDIFIETAKILKNKNFNFEILIAGRPVMEEDKIYLEELEKTVKENRLEGKIIFSGAIPYKDIAGFYCQGDLFVNFSDTGSIDKAMLEAMASGLLVLTSNESFKDILPEKYFTSKKPIEIGEKIMTFSATKPDKSLRDYVVKNHGLENLAAKLSTFFNKDGG